MEKQARRFAAYWIAALIILVFLDIANLPTKLGLPMGSLNWDLLSLLVGNSVVIALFLITFNLIDRKKLQTEENQRKTACLLLEHTYKTCKTTASMLQMPEMIEAIVKKCDFDKPVYEEPIHQRLRNSAFEHNNEILAFASDGLITKDELSEYLQVQEYYKGYVSNRIMLYDRPHLTLDNYKKLCNMLDSALGKIKPEG